MCVTGANLPQTAFDPETGEVIAEDLTYDYASPSPGPYPAPSPSPESEYDSVYDSIPEDIAFVEKFTGNVSGAKPLIGTCMAMRDTPVIPVNSLDLSMFMNLDDRNFADVSQATDAYKSSNYYINRTFFIGGAIGEGNLSCPDNIVADPPFDFKRETIEDRANFWRYKADNCYNFYILNHASDPWYYMERPDGGTDDPLSIYDPERSALNNCQPLIRGDWAQYIQRARWDTDLDGKQKYYAKELEKTVGFAPVYQSPRPDVDEAEYRLSDLLKNSWNDNFVNLQPQVGIPFSSRYTLKQTIPHNYDLVGLPCVTASDGTTEITPPYTSPKEPGATTGHDHSPQCRPDSAPDSPSDPAPECGPHPFPLPSYHYTTKPQGNYYCPNVEKITEPSHPFSPRHLIVGTDRAYSGQTSIKLADPTNCSGGEPKYGYTNYNEEYFAEYRDAWPAVQCAVVPVDILSFRQGAFHTCITQRINYNLNAFIKQWKDTGIYPNPATYQAPCSTRFWENDSGACPMRLSIQQCCRIIVKDVTPANFLKLRTCDMLLQNRSKNKTIQHDIKEVLSVDPDSPPITWVYDGSNTSNGVWASLDRSAGWNAYHRAMLAVAAFDGETCVAGSEPDEYRFDHFFAKYYGPKDPSDSDNDKIEGKFIGVHMPYMRWWDTGVAAGNPYHSGNFVNTLGGYDTLVGIGRETRDEQQAKDTAQDAKDHNATSAEIARLKQFQPSEMGRIGGWSELKAHQMWTIRRNNLYCLGRYEKLFKPGGADNFVLSKAGAGYTSRKGLQWPWPLGWRGYATDSTFGTILPYSFGHPIGYKENVARGLDNALPGDIIFYYRNGIKQVAYVTDIGFDLADPTQATFDFNTSKFMGPGGPLIPNRVFVVSWDQGKFPTSTASTLNWGIGPERTIYKQAVPKNYQQDICNRTLRTVTDSDPTKRECRDGAIDESLNPGACMTNNCQPSCNDSDFSACVLDNSKDDWDNVQIYRPYHDVRRCNGTPFSAVGGGFSLPATYDWTGSITLGAAPPPSVIFQSMTQNLYTDLWAYCVNSGFDAPGHFAKDYKGAQTGAMTDTTLCGPKWHQCSSAGALEWYPPAKPQVNTPPPPYPPVVP